MAKLFSIYQCTNSECCFRFPAVSENNIYRWCPQCKSPVSLVYSYSEEPNIYPQRDKMVYPLNLSLLLDNIRSVYNVGSILRSADGLNIEHIYFCGITAKPDNPKISKTSLGAEKAGFWSYSPNCLSQTQELKKSRKMLIGLESCQESKSIFEISPSRLKKDIVLILGNELAGIDPQVREICDELVYIPMQGKKSSLNVTIAFGIAAFFLNYLFKQR